MEYHEAFKDHVFKEYLKIWENMKESSTFFLKEENHFQVYERLLSGRES